MNKVKLKKVSKEIIRNNVYLSLGTATNSIPWIAPLYYAVDKKYTFYFISQLNSLHIQHILKNPQIAFAIFDSHQKEGTGNGVQGSGKAFLLKEEELLEAFKWYHTTYIEMKTESFKEPAPYRFFKIIPEHFYVLNPDAPTDKRVEVKL